MDFASSIVVCRKDFFKKTKKSQGKCDSFRKSAVIYLYLYSKRNIYRYGGRTLNITEVKKRTTTLRVICLLEEIREFAKKHCGEAVTVTLGAILSFGEFLGIYPFGIAFACTFGTKYPLAFAGPLVLSLVLENGGFCFASTVLAFLASFTMKRLGASEQARIFASAAASSVGVIGCGIFPFVFSLLATPVLAIGFSGLLPDKKLVPAPLADWGFLSLGFAVAYSLAGFNLGMFSFALIMGVFFSLEGGEKGGYLLGGLSGFLLGCVVNVNYGLPMAIGGFVCGAFVRKHRVMSILLFLSLSDVGVLLLCNGEDGLIYALSSLWGVGLWLAISDLYLDKKRNETPFALMALSTDGKKQLSVAVGGIASMLSAVSKSKRRERREKTKRVVDNVFFKECETCNGCGISTDRIRENICFQLEKGKKIGERDFSPLFTQKCVRWKIIMSNLNALVEKDPVKGGIRMDTLAEDYSAMAKLLEFGERSRESRMYRDVSISRKIKLELELKNIRVARVETVGARVPLVEIGGIPFKTPFQEGVIKSVVENAISKSTSTVLFETEGKMAKMRFKAVCPMKVESYKISIPKSGEIICGDTGVTFETDDGYFYSIISDGMGSGRDAAVCSRLGVTFLERLISSGIDKAGVVSMLGKIIASSEDEIFTTVDLAEVDLVRGKLTVIKAGAAPTWILRNKRAYSITSGTMPCGILPSVAAEQTVFNCVSGDYIIQASDGGEAVVSDVIKEVISSGKKPSPKDFASMLANSAVQQNGRNDDISFCVMLVL